MIGFPKHLNSRADFEYVKENFPDKWRPLYQSLLDERNQWFNLGKLADGEEGVEDATHKVIVSDMQGVTERYQYEFRLDPNCNLIRLGYTVEEVEALLAE